MRFGRWEVALTGDITRAFLQTAKRTELFTDSDGAVMIMFVQGDLRQVVFFF